MKVTFEIAVFALSGRLIQCGHVDDLYPSLGKLSPRVDLPDLRFALEAMSANKAVEIAGNSATDCYIEGRKA
ncbi:MAG: hypothetical protein EOO38_24150 [Cytophagaceae bacterium]|nr:MAG: hypothetical protein EOO38_24150 [Cytophagaceae bacterium]